MVRRWRWQIARSSAERTPHGKLSNGSPTHFVFGRGAEEQVGEKLAAAGAKRVLVHFGEECRRMASRLIDRVGASPDAAGIEHLELGGVRPNPEITLVREGVRLCRRLTSIACAVGGGSVIDSAKAIASGACVEGDGNSSKPGYRPRRAAHRRGAHHPRRRQRGLEETRSSPTTSWAARPAYANNAQRPKFAFMNPELTFTLPPLPDSRWPYRHVLPPAGALFDDLGAVPVTDNLEPVASMNTIRAEAPRVLADPDNYDARANIAMLGRHALPSGGSPGGPPRGLGHPRFGARAVGAESAITHGAVSPSCSLPGWSTCTPRTPARFAFYGRRCSASRPPATWEADALAIDETLLLREHGDAHHSCRAGRGRDRHPKMLPRCWPRTRASPPAPSRS